MLSFWPRFDQSASSTTIGRQRLGGDLTMTISSLVLALLLLAGGDPNGARKDFSSCLHAFGRTNLDKKTTPDEFDTLVATACAKEEGDFRSAVIASDVSRGISRKTSEQGVADEIADYRAVMKESYRGDFEAAAKPN
jgi:hypothetical protein